MAIDFFFKTLTSLWSGSAGAPFSDLKISSTTKINWNKQFSQFKSFLILNADIKGSP